MKIAIQGHPTRFREVIDTLINLGGINKYNYKGNDCTISYYINESNHIAEQFNSNIDTSLYKLYTLEKFEKEFPFKIRNKVIFKNDISSNPIIYTITGFEFYRDEFCYLLDDSCFHYSASKLKLHKSMKERNITLTLDKAKEWYNKGGELKEIALQAFTKEELNLLPKSWEEYCKIYPIQAAQCSSLISCPKKYIALWKLEQLRDYYRQGWKPTYCLYNSTSWYCIYNLDRSILASTTTLPCFLSFQGETIAQEFLKNFESLIKEAGDLI